MHETKKDQNISRISKNVSGYDIYTMIVIQRIIEVEIENRWNNIWYSFHLVIIRFWCNFNEIKYSSVNGKKFTMCETNTFTY